MQKEAPTLLGVTASLLTCALLTAYAHASGSSTTSSASSPSAQASRHYYFALGLPWYASRFADALPGEFGQPGRERRTIQGTITRAAGTTSFSFTRQLDEDVRLDLTGPTAATLIAANLSGQPAFQSNAPAASAEADEDLLETLAEDSPEGFLFSFEGEATLSWLGGNFRTDSGTNTAYKGPYYDIYRQNATLRTLPGNPKRSKLFYFDSTTKLLAATRYRIQRNGSAIAVEVSYGGWTTVSGQMVPAQIIRKENGQQVFSISVKSAASSASQTDGLFTIGG